jgi:outer membrane lipoprotein SlyB
MSKHRKSLSVAALACALALPAAAQVEYRYPGTEDPARSATQQPVPQPLPQQTVQQQPAPPSASLPVCPECGTVESIRSVAQAAEGSGLGMIAGGVLGGLLGHQVGQGRGNTAATIVGAAGGAYAGHQVEKNVKQGTRYDVNVRMNDGTIRTVSYDTEPGFRSGDRVRIVDGKLTRN